jgi:hypothetical protein
VNNEIKEQQSELKRENAFLKESLRKNELKTQYSMMCANNTNLPTRLRMLLSDLIRALMK